MHRKNVLLLVVDCLRQDVFSAAGGYLGQMSREGSCFTQALTPITTTTPSLASMLTGLYPFEHGIVSLQGFKLNEGARTLPQALRENGYATLAFVTGPLLQECGLAHGFTAYRYREWQDYFSGGTERRILRAIRAAPEPWFVLLHLWELHEPVRRRPTPAADFARRVAGRVGLKLERATLDDAAHRRAYVEGMANVARIVRSLRRALPGMDLLVLTGDHGERLEEPLSDREAKRCTKRNPRHGFNVYEYLLNVPLLFWGRDVPPRSVATPVRTIDIAPTVLEYLGLDPLGPTSGSSLWPPLRDGSDPPARDLICSASGITLRDKADWIEGLRTETYKYTVKPHSPGKEEALFRIDHGRDVPLPAEGEAARILVELRERFLAARHGRRAEGSAELDNREREKVAELLESLGYL